MAATEKGLVLTGARSRFSIGGKKIGWARNVNGGESIDYSPVEVLDNLEVQEFVPIAYRANLNAERVKITGKTPKSQGFMPKSGQDSDQHLLNVLNAPDLSAAIEDVKSPSTTVYEFPFCKMASRNFQITSRGLVGEDMDFVTIRLLDESEL